MSRKHHRPATPMTKEAASRIQSHADRTGLGQDFARRAQSAADRAQRPATTRPDTPAPMHPRNQRPI